MGEHSQRFPKGAFERVKMAYDAQEMNRARRLGSDPTAAMSIAEHGRQLRKAARESRDQQQDRVRQERAQQDATEATFDVSRQGSPCVNPSSLVSAAAQSMKMPDELNGPYGPELEEDEDGNAVDYDDDEADSSGEPAKIVDDLFSEPLPRTEAEMKADAQARNAKTDKITEATAREHQEREKAA